jgi:hypothetical protein
MKRRAAIAMIVVGAGLMMVAFGSSVAHHGDESTMYWFGLGGLLTVVGIGAIQGR